MILRIITTLVALMTALLVTPCLAAGQQDDGKYRILLENEHVRVVEYTLDSGSRAERGDRPHGRWYAVDVSPHRIVFVEPRGVFPAAPREEDPALVNPTSITVKIENDSVRVLEAALPPGFKETMHSHPGYVMYIVDGGTVRLHMADGRTRDSAFKAGDIFYSDPVTHWAENTGTTTIRVVLVELRRR
jgi:quercetin dioxygenase-like cupin family protein